jgi:hypothetical protein
MDRTGGWLFEIPQIFQKNLEGHAKSSQRSTFRSNLRHWLAQVHAYQLGSDAGT